MNTLPSDPSWLWGGSRTSSCLDLILTVAVSVKRFENVSSPSPPGKPENSSALKSGPCLHLCQIETTSINLLWAGFCVPGLVGVSRLVDTEIKKESDASQAW